MKRITKSKSAIVLIIISVLIAIAAGTENKKTASVKWKSLEYDFGKIKTGSQVYAEFEVKNTSMIPLIIKSVKPTCGCTVAEYPKQPVKPGASAKIKAAYNNLYPGYFKKSIYVYANTQTEKTTLTFKGVGVK